MCGAAKRRACSGATMTRRAPEVRCGRDETRRGGNTAGGSPTRYRARVASSPRNLVQEAPVAAAPLRRVVHPSGVVTYRSERLHEAGFAHAFSTRLGGVSPPPFDTMNLGIAQAPGEPDTESNVATNAARLMEAAGLAHAQMVRVRQVHGSAVYHCRGTERFGPPVEEADAILSTHAHAAPCVRTADCVPVLLACTRTGAVAAVHAGWRGIVAGVVTAAVRELAALGAREAPGTPQALHARAGDFLAAIGPAIGVEAYEVGEEVAEAFARAGLEAYVARRTAWPRPHLDCAGAVRAQLVAGGLAPECIEGGTLCTVACEFFSYRADGPRSGRLAAVIGVRTAGAVIRSSRDKDAGHG